MAIKLISQEWSNELGDDMEHYICDTDADFANLPKAPTGSTAISVESGAVRMVNASGVWAYFGG
jgi:hypothetical protein